MTLDQIYHCLAIVRLMVKLFGQGFGSILDIADIVRSCPFF